MKFRISRSLVLWLGLPGLAFVLWLWAWSMSNTAHFWRAFGSDHQIQITAIEGRFQWKQIRWHGAGPRMILGNLLRRTPQPKRTRSLSDWFPPFQFERTENAARIIDHTPPAPSRPPRQRILVPPSPAGTSAAPAATPPVPPRPTPPTIVARASKTTFLQVPLWTILTGYLALWAGAVAWRWKRAMRIGKEAG
jgi:hypothetical protein